MKLLQVGFDESGRPGPHRDLANALGKLAPASDGSKNLLAHAIASGPIAHEIERKLPLTAAHNRTVQL
jgi:hypothetical protein